MHPVAATIEARKLVNGEFFSRSTPNFTNITGTERSSSRLRPWTSNSRKILLHWRGRSATGTLQPKAQAPPRACTDRNGAIVSRSALLWTPAAHANKHAYQGGVGAMPIWVIVAIIPVTLLGGVLLVSGGGPGGKHLKTLLGHEPNILLVGHETKRARRTSKGYHPSNRRGSLGP